MKNPHIFIGLSLIVLTILTSCESSFPLIKTVFKETNYSSINSYITDTINSQKYGDVNITIEPVFADDLSSEFKELSIARGDESILFYGRSTSHFIMEDTPTLILDSKNPFIRNAENSNLFLQSLLGKSIDTVEFKMIQNAMNNYSDESNLSQKTEVYSGINHKDAEFNPYFLNENKLMTVFKIEFENTGNTFQEINCSSFLVKNHISTELFTTNEFFEFRSNLSQLNPAQKIVLSLINCDSTEIIPPQSTIVKYFPTLPISEQSEKVDFYFGDKNMKYSWIFNNQSTLINEETTYTQFPVKFIVGNVQFWLKTWVLINPLDPNSILIDKGNLYWKRNENDPNPKVLIYGFDGNYHFIFKGELPLLKSIHDNMNSVKPIEIQLTPFYIQDIPKPITK